MPQGPQEELDLFMNTFEKALNEINNFGPYNTALAVQAAKRVVHEVRAGRPEPQPTFPKRR